METRTVILPFSVYLMAFSIIFLIANVIPLESARIKAGFSESEIGTYLFFGLPGQSIDEVIEGIKFVKSSGSLVNLVEYSPIPGTVMWNELESERIIKNNIEDIWGLKLKSELESNTNIYDLTNKIIDKKSDFAASLLFLALS